jgi:hypothetical protein
MLWKCFRVVVLGLTGTVLAFEPAKAGVTIDCDTQSISSALASGEKDITVNGTCSESVVVHSDDVTIEGGVNGVIDGALTVYGAQRFTMRYMAVTASTDGLEGIWVTHGASANIRNVTVSGEPEFCAILVFYDSFAEIRNSILDGNACGLSVGVGSLVSSRGNTITNTENTAVEVYQHGTYRARDDTIDASLSGEPTITVSRNSFLHLRPADVTGNIAVSHQSHLYVQRESTVTGDIGVNILSELDLKDSAVTGKIRAENLSIVKISDGATVDGSVSCLGTSMCLPRPPK